MKDKVTTDGYITDKFIKDCELLLDANSDNEVVGSINTRQGQSLKCDFEVIVILKVLLKTGITYNDKLAQACRVIFKQILGADKMYITCNKVLNAILADTYETKQLHCAIATVLGSVTT